MTARIFALIVGVDKYKSGNIWNLESCVDDVQNVKRWLTSDLHVPHDQICVLLDVEATKRKIEDKFMSHLVNNPAIEQGDAILIYFACHGSHIRSPPGWFDNGRGDVEVLCTYDHDTKLGEGRVAGISDRSLHAMIKDLYQVKGDNITLVLDTCFTAPSEDTSARSHVRYTPTKKASADDLLSGLWKSAVVKKSQQSSSCGFTATSHGTHVVLAACGTGWIATEGKAGGNFTRAIMMLKDRVALHKLTYTDVAAEASALMDDHQHAVSLGKHTDRILFNGIPFMPDGGYISIDVYDDEKLLVDAGAIHGIVEGTEFSIHQHNRRGSLNPVLATYSVVQVQPTYSLARRKSSTRTMAQASWARITRWNNRTPFRVHIRNSLLTILRRFRLRGAIPSDTEKAAARPGLNMLRVNSATHADISVKTRRRELVVERHDSMITSNCRRIIHLPSSETSSDLRIIDDAARFHLHLNRKNPARPLSSLVTMELFRLDSSSWVRVSGNLLVNGKAEIIDDEKASIYAVVIHNYSEHDLWPYLAYMDASGYGITMVHHPDMSASSSPPLLKHSHMVIGSGSTDSEALSFSLAEGSDIGSGFLKLFVSTSFTPMTFIEQGPLPSPVEPGNLRKGGDKLAEDGIWDAVTACVTVARKPDKGR